MEGNELFTELVKEFPCLCNPQDPGFADDTQRSEACKLLHDKYNGRAESPVDIITLKLWVAAFYNKLKTGRVRKDVCSDCIAQCNDIGELLLDFPCLWDFQDLNYKDEEVKAHCCRQLIKTYNEQRCKEGYSKRNCIGMGDLKIKLSLFKQIRLQCSCWKNKTRQSHGEKMKPKAPIKPEKPLNKSELHKFKPKTPKKPVKRVNKTEPHKLKPKKQHKRVDRTEPHKLTTTAPSKPVTATEWREMVMRCLYLWNEGLDYNIDNIVKKAQARELLKDKYKEVFGITINRTELDARLTKLCKEVKRRKSREMRQKVKNQSLESSSSATLRPREITATSSGSGNSQSSSGYSEVPCINEEPNDDIDMGRDGNVNTPHEDIKPDISVTDTEFVKQTVNIYVRHKKKKADVDLNSLPLPQSLLDDNDRNDSENRQNTPPPPVTANDLGDKVVFVDEQSGVKIATLKEVKNYETEPRKPSDLELGVAEDSDYIIAVRICPRKRKKDSVCEVIRVNEEFPLESVSESEVKFELASEFNSEELYSVELPRIFS